MKTLLLTFATAAICVSVPAAEPLAKQLKKERAKIAYETYVDNNWEIFVSNADGSKPVNLSKTKDLHEHYPQVSADGRKICYTVDVGEGRETVRSLWVMDVNGKNRKNLVDHAREPFWSPDSKTIGFLPQEFPKFNVVDYYTKGMSFYDLKTGKIEEHPNAANLHHLYNPSFAPNGKWIVSTVHAGMGFGHAILAIERNGTNIVNLGIPGCRPSLSPDGKQIAWGAGDHEIAAAPIDLESMHPKVGPPRVQIKDSKNKIYHVDWSPDNKFLSISRGPESDGDLTKPGSFHAACEMVGSYAKDWNILAISATRDGVLDLNSAADSDYTMVTTNGLSNKESAWIPLRKK